VKLYFPSNLGCLKSGGIWGMLGLFEMLVVTLAATEEFEAAFIIDY
jgi:hypothetical protein